MKTVLSVVGGLLMVIGAIWVLQGINLLPGSFMTGQLQWAVYGGLSFFAGAALVVLARRPPRP